jgi:hypothetical protein
VGNRFPPPTSLKQLEDVPQKEWYKIPLETVQYLYESIQRRFVAVLKEGVVKNHNNKEICIVCLVFPLFCPTPVTLRIRIKPPKPRGRSSTVISITAGFEVSQRWL